ncbi:MAG: mechanosensitive ion channel protein MscS [Candidatus Methanoperedenaceae archaeon]|nr:MAG: mechanosensitive ion channel protein MscS [Candidatus Methanoperedenaceae archaeon]
MIGDKISIGNVTLDNFLIFIFVIIITIVGGNISYAFTRRLLDDRISFRYSRSIARVVEYMVLLLGFYYGIYKVLHYDLNAFIASLGLIGIAVAFGSQQIIQNFIAGLLISVGRPVRPEDWVEIGDSGISIIKDINLTRTVLRNRNGKLFSIPNSILISSIVANYTKSGFVEISVPLSVPGRCSIEQVRKIILDVANEHASILPNVSGEEKDIISKLFKLPSIRILFQDKMDTKIFEPKVLLSGISDSRINLSIRLWIREVYRKDEIISEFFESLFKRFIDEKIDLK